MSIAKRCLQGLLIALIPTALSACEAEKKEAPAATANKPPAQPAATPAQTSTPPPVASVAKEPPHDCPEGSSGEGSSNKPCEAHGPERAIDVDFDKFTDNGPQLKLANKTKKTILWGKLIVYFYDKAGKQLEVKDATGKSKPNKVAMGKIFGGPLKPEEKNVRLTFSDVKKSDVPDGATRAEGELEKVGFADDSGEKVDFYWKNDDLVPAERAKGGLKPEKGAKKK